MVYIDNKTETQQIWIPRNNAILVKENPYESIRKIEDYLYEVWYDGLDYKYAEEYFNSRAPITVGNCSAIKVNGLAGRKYDWIDNYEAVFVVHTPAKSDKYAVLGVAGSLKDLTVDFVGTGAYSDAYKILPFYLQDGFNEKQLHVEMNVVPAKSNTRTIPVVEKQESVCSIALVRYILENFDTVDNAVNYITNYVEIFMPQSLIDMGYEVHYLISDPTKTVVLEIIDNQIKIVDSNISTNFHLFGTSIQNEVYTPVTAKNGLFPSTQGVEQYGSGLERYNVLKQAQIEDIDDMRETLRVLDYSNAYTLPADTNFWYTEFVGLGSDGVTDITVDTVYDNPAFINRVVKYKEIWERHTKDSGTCWISVHTSIYDFERMTLWVSVQERETEHPFVLLPTYEEGFEDGEEAQKAKLASTGFTANGHYQREDGWNDVVVDVPLRYEEGYEDGEREQKAKLTSTGFTTNGNYFRENGWNNVSVNVPSRYQEGYEDGVANQKAKLTSTNITNNGTYTREDGYNRVVVNVPTGDTINNQTKNILITENGEQVIRYDNGYTGLEKVNLRVNVPTGSTINNQDKHLDITTNQNLRITADPGYTGLGVVKVDINVPDRYEEGYEDGEEAQKTKLESISITSNGHYAKEDGYNDITVNVPTETVNNQDKTLSITQNGTSVVSFDTGYTGLNTVTVNTNVPDRYEEGKEDGKEEQKGLMINLNVTENKTYTRENGYKQVVVNVPTGDTINNQDKSITITENGSQNVTFDTGYTGLGTVNITTNVHLTEYVVVSLTQEEYDNIPVKDNNTIYMISCI